MRKQIIDFKNWLWKYLFWLSLTRIRGSWTLTGARTIYRFRLGKYEATTTLRDMMLEDTYGREEVYELLKIVRENEERMGWKCPEPTE